MQKTKLLVLVVVGTGLSLCCPGLARADVPPPPVNQIIGYDDVRIGDLSKELCQACHGAVLVDRHHLLYGLRVTSRSVVPFPDTDGDGIDDERYGCLSCHGSDFTLERDCTVCHTRSPHHSGAAQDGVCTGCHGDIVEDIHDGHYIPDYPPSLVTPTPSDGTAMPLNSRGVSAGGCNYCHDEAPVPDDSVAPPVFAVIRTARSLHHGSGVPDFAGHTNCNWCHVVSIDPDTGEQEVLGAEDGASGPERMRACENCHGPDSLHAIQVDSDGDGCGVVGGELAGYGHVGKDAPTGLPPNDQLESDCWGCHGFSADAMASAAVFGPTVPVVRHADRKVITAGKDTVVTLVGSALINMGGRQLYQSQARLTGTDGTSVTFAPDSLTDEALTVTIPGDTPAGNYRLQAVKDRFSSNPAVISVVPEVTITSILCTRRGTVIVRGSGFGGYAPDSGTGLTTTKTTGWRRARKTSTVQGRIIAWSDERIVATFGTVPGRVEVHSVFGKATSSVRAVGR